MKATTKFHRLGFALIVIAGLAGAPLALSKLPVAVQVRNEFCPVLPDEKVDSTIYTNYKGQRVYFCCTRCRRDFLRSPGLYLANLSQFHSANSTIPDSEGHQDSAAYSMGESSDLEPKHHGDEHTSTHEEIHEHATDHVQESDAKLNWVNFAGKFHPLVVHFPIALLITAALAELSSWASSKKRLQAFSRHFIYFTAACSVVAATLGWAAAWNAHYPIDLMQYLTFHRWVGTSVAGLSMVAAYFAWAAERSSTSVWFKWALRGVLLLAAIGAGLAGHLGSIIVLGPDHFAF
ncbi:hypothetical protein HUU59_08470 [bacterium]|nr:hypothetical protein [bacterium]